MANGFTAHPVSVNDILDSVTTGVNASGRTVPGARGIFSFGAGNPEPSYGERSLLLIKIIRKNHHFCAHFVSFYIFL
jgi:hypothetical protein